MPHPFRSSTHAERLRTALPPVLVLAGAVGYVGIDLWGDELPSGVPSGAAALAHAGLVALQAVILVFRRRSPLAAFAGVVLVDLVILATTAGELGIGTLGVLIASYTVARYAQRRVALIALTAGAIATTAVGGVAMLLGSTEAAAVLAFTIVARIAILYAGPAGVAEYIRSRERLESALREQARMAETERRDRADRETRAERTALARELHDIAGHHLSGIIVSAQAASALTRSDPERAREMMQTVQDSARTTLVDLRRTVGLLRSDDESPQHPEAPSATPTIDGIAGLVSAARKRGQRVEIEVTGTRRALGPLAEAAAYRMVQESLANAARHARGAAATVTVAFTSDAVDVAVVNDAEDEPRVIPSEPSRGGYGLSGMAERAELIGARLVTGPTADGGWANRLTITDSARNDT